MRSWLRATPRGLWDFMFMLLLVASLPGCLEQISGTADPELSVDTTSLRFGESLTAKQFRISNSGGGRLDWSVSVSDGSAWCAVNPDAGSDGSTITVYVDRSNLTPGEHATHLAVESNGGTAEILIQATVRPTTGDIVIDVELPE